MVYWWYSEPFVSYSSHLGFSKTKAHVKKIKIIKPVSHQAYDFLPYDFLICIWYRKAASQCPYGCFSYCTMLAASTSEIANNFYDSRKMAVGLSCKFTKLSQGCRKNSCSHPYDKEKNVRLSHECLTMFVRSSCEKGQYPKPLKIVRNHMSTLRLSWGCLTAAVQRAKIAKKS